MQFRLAATDDLPKLQAMYQKIVERMHQNGIFVWDESYPCEFLGEDIANHRLYLLSGETGELLAAFALCAPSGSAEDLLWPHHCNNALYLERLGVSASAFRQGIGSALLAHAAAAAAEKGADCLRLFVVDSNLPAINFYLKNGFCQADGIHLEQIDEELTLKEYGFEKEVS